MVTSGIAHNSIRRPVGSTNRVNIYIITFCFFSETDLLGHEEESVLGKLRRSWALLQPVPGLFIFPALLRKVYA